MEKSWKEIASELMTRHRGDLMKKYVSRKHYIDDNETIAVDRTHYDTPGSVIGCPCPDCNRVRDTYGKKKIKFPKISVSVLNFSHDTNSHFYHNEPATDDYQVFLEMGSVEMCVLNHGNTERD